MKAISVTGLINETVTGIDFELRERSRYAQMRAMYHYARL